MHDYLDQSHDHMINHPPHHHDHHDDEMALPYRHRWAPCNDDQIPVISQVGRGPAGDTYVVRPKNDGNCEEFYLQGFRVNGSTGEEELEWESRNISGGYLHDLNHTYRVRPWNDPPTFNMTFIYHKPTCCSWSWVTPNIPYCWNELGPYPEHMVGTGVATLFVRTDAVDHDKEIGEKGNPVDDKWIEKLIYPDGTTREQYNAPDPLEDWTVNLTFGLEHGDVLVPNLYDLADILGWEPGNVYNIVVGEKGQLDGSDNVKDYIDDQLGFGDGVLVGNDGDLTIKDLLGFDENYFLNGGTVKNYIDGLLDDLFKKIWYGGGSTDLNQATPDTPPAGKTIIDENYKPHILWTTAPSEHIAMGNMNLYGGDTRENWIKTDIDGTNDVWAR